MLLVIPHMQDFGCSRDDFNCACPNIVNTTSGLPLTPQPEPNCSAAPSAAPTAATPAGPAAGAAAPAQAAAKQAFPPSQNIPLAPSALPAAVSAALGQVAPAPAPGGSAAPAAAGQLPGWPAAGAAYNPGQLSAAGVASLISGAPVGSVSALHAAPAAAPAATPPQAFTGGLYATGMELPGAHPLGLYYTSFFFFWLPYHV